MVDLDRDYIAEGQAAEYLMARIRPHLTKQSDAAVQALMAAFRTNSLTLEMALTLVATLVAVDTVSKELGRLIRLGKDDQQQARQG